MRVSKPLILQLIAASALIGAVVAAPDSSGDAPVPAKAAPELPTDPAVIKSDSSQALGFQFGQIFLQELGSKGVTASDIDLQAFAKGFERSIGGEKIDVAEQEKLGAALQAFDKQLQARQTKLTQENKEAGEKFLAENKKKPGVKTTSSGLQYEILKEGTGKKYEGDGTDAPQFKVRYEGRLVDGKKFDGNLQGEPATFTLQVIPGFKEALMMMPSGSLWRLFIPSNLAYGDRAAGGGAIPPGSSLIFDLELVEVMKAPTATTPPIAIPGQ